MLDSNEEDMEFWDCIQCKHKYTTPYFQSKTETKVMPHPNNHTSGKSACTKYRKRHPIILDPTVQRFCHAANRLWSGHWCRLQHTPVYKARKIFKQQWLSPDQLTVYIQAFGGQTVRYLWSCMVYMHTKGKIYKVRCKVTDTPCYPILVREQRSWTM